MLLACIASAIAACSALATTAASCATRKIHPTWRSGCRLLLRQFRVAPRLRFYALAFVFLITLDSVPVRGSCIIVRLIYVRLIHLYKRRRNFPGVQVILFLYSNSLKNPHLITYIL
jgi:hypothetical protein